MVCSGGRLPCNCSLPTIPRGGITASRTTWLKRQWRGEGRLEEQQRIWIYSQPKAGDKGETVAGIDKGTGSGRVSGTDAGGKGGLVRPVDTMLHYSSCRLDTHSRTHTYTHTHTHVLVPLSNVENHWIKINP